MAAQGGGQFVEAKVVVLGDHSVGKTCLLHKYHTGQFQNQVTTIGGAFIAKELKLGPHRVSLGNIFYKHVLLRKVFCL